MGRSMKKTILHTLVCIIAFGAGLFQVGLSPAGTMNTIKEAVLRASHSFVGKIVETLPGGTAVTLMSEEGAWPR